MPSWCRPARSTPIVFRASAFHAAINYALYDFSYAALGPTSAFGPGPKGDDDEAAWLAMFPPYDIAYDVIELYFPLTLRLNRLGAYGKGLDDPALAPLLERYQARLEAIEAEIDRRNAHRFLPYTYGKPSLVTQSIHV